MVNAFDTFRIIIWKQLVFCIDFGSDLIKFYIPFSDIRSVSVHNSYCLTVISINLCFNNKHLLSHIFHHCCFLSHKNQTMRNNYNCNRSCFCHKAELFQLCQLCKKPINLNDCIIQSYIGWIHTQCHYKPISCINPPFS